MDLFNTGITAQALMGVPMTPAKYGGSTNTDATDAIQKLFNSFGVGDPTALPGTYSTPSVKLVPGATYYVSKSITIPHFLSVDFNGARILPLPSAPLSNFYPYDGVTGYIFLLGCDLTGNQVLGNQGTVLPKIYGGNLYNLVPATPPATGYVPVMVGLKAFWHKSRHAVEDMTIQGFYGAITKQNVGGGDVYTDLLTFRRLNIASAKGSDWMLDIAYHGDGLRIDQITTTQLPENLNAIRVDRCRGGQISNVLNGNVLITRSDGISYTNFHHETGYIETQGSSVEIANGHIWHRESTQKYIDPTGVDKGFSVPIRHLQYLDSDRPARHLTLRNVRFVNINIAGNSNDMTVGYVDTDNPDLYIDQFAPAEITGCHRSFEPSSTYNTTSDSGILVTRSSSTVGALWTEWSNISAYASKHSILSAGEISTLPVTSTITDTYTQNSTASVSSRGVFSAPSATYYYCEVVLNGPTDRLLASVGPEKSVALLQNGNAPMWTYTERAVDFPGFSNMTRRIYRGTSPGVYDKYLDLPGFKGQRWYDLGYWEGTGYRWKSRTPGPIDTFNVITDLISVRIQGRTIVLTGVATLPTMGMVDGDRFSGTNFEAVYRGSVWQVIGGLPISTSPGDADYTVSSIRPGGSIVYAAPLTATRIVTLPSTSGVVGPPYVIERTTASTGSNLVIRRGGTTLTTLTGKATAKCYPTSSSYTVQVIT